MKGSIDCVYETPCGWCSKWNKKCDCKIGADTATHIDPKSGEETDISKLVSATSINSRPKRCRTCMYADREQLNSSNPLSNNVVPQVRCVKTDRWHYIDDICDCDSIQAIGGMKNG